MALLSWSLLALGFVLGVVSIVAVEAAALLFLLKRLNEKIKSAESVSKSVQSVTAVDPQQSLHFTLNKQGVVWILASDEFQSNWLVEKLPREQKRRKEFLEVSPIRKNAKIKDHILILKDSDGSHTTIQLRDCVIKAVSATNLPSRKWGKRFPIKIENKNSVIYSGSKTFYMYLETSWEKEAWCKALRLASCEDKEKINWFTKLNKEFHSFLTSCNTGYPSFLKPTVGFNSEPGDKGNRTDVSSSKIRLFWKKLARKASKPSLENRGVWMNSSNIEQRKTSERLRPFQDSLYGINLVKNGSAMKMPISSTEENPAVPSSSTFSHTGSQSNISVISDVESEDKFNIDEGTLCWNLLISRLFFDAKWNVSLKSSIQARIQRTLSNMRTPSYMGEVICTDIDIGNLPPYIHSMRVPPLDLNEVWAFEVDLEYCGGAVLSVETRLEVSELDLQKGIVDANSESIATGDVSSDLLEGFEYFRKHLNNSEGIDGAGNQNEEDDGAKGSKGALPGSTHLSRWKSILNTVAKQVSQVPLSLSIRVSSFRGTARVFIKPPPSDQLWFGFTSMPEIDFGLQSSIGEHKITNGHIALFLISRFKAAIRETMVLPNCESVCVPWMLAEKDDWVPRSVAPFLWLNQEAGSSDYSPVHEVFSVPSEEAKTKTEVSKTTTRDHPERKHQKQKKVENIQPLITESTVVSTSKSIPSISPGQNNNSLQELKVPLLGSNGSQEKSKREQVEIPGCNSQSGSPIQLEKPNGATDDDESRPKKMGKKARMLDLGKKMGEKFEEKRRHIEEKGRHIVEKMKGP